MTVFVISPPFIYTAIALEKKTVFCKHCAMSPHSSLQDFSLECLRKYAVVEIKLFGGQT